MRIDLCFWVQTGLDERVWIRNSRFCRVYGRACGMETCSFREPPKFFCNFLLSSYRHVQRGWCSPRNFFSIFCKTLTRNAQGMMMAMRVLSFARCYLIHKKSISESKAQMFCFPCAQDEHLCKILSYAHKSHLWKESLDAHFLAKEETIRREAAVSSDLQQEEEEDMRWVFFFFFCIFFETNNPQLLGLSFVSRIRQAKLHLIAVSWLWNLIHACSNWILAVVFLSLIERGVMVMWWERERSSLLIPDLISLATAAASNRSRRRAAGVQNNMQNKQLE